MKRFFLWFWRHKKLSIVLVLVLVAVVFYFRSRNGNEEFETATSARGDVAEEMILPGAIKADEHAQLSFPISGRLVWVNMKVGDEATKGQPLASIDTKALVSALERARADLRTAEAARAAVYDSLQGKTTTETFAERNIRTSAEAAYDKAYEVWMVAQNNLRDATLVAPFAGKVTQVVNPFSGVNIVAGQTQIEVVNPKTIYFQVAADQSEVVDIKTGERVKIIFDATDEEIEGEVANISYTTQAGEVGAVYAVRIKFTDSPNEEFKYRIGMTGDAHFVLAEKKDVVFVPANFVKSDSKGDYVLINEGKEKAYVTIGLEGEERTEIVSGIGEGALIYD